MPDKRDYYEILSVTKTATAEEISVAYRQSALKYHPDRNPGDEEAVKKFKEAAEAFDVLRDPDKRSRYDRFGHAGVQSGPGGAHHFTDLQDIFEAFGDMFGGGVFGDIFGGGRGGRKRQRKGDDLRVDLTLDLMEAVKGCQKTIQFERSKRCEECSGSGAKPGSSPQQCSYCGGRGQVVQQAGILRVQTTCPACHGAGSMIKDPCRKCRGQGYVAERIQQNVRVPAGVDDGMRIRLAGEGNPSPNGGPNGDCYCFVSVKEHPLFHREGQHLVVRVPITYAQAALGATIEVPTLDGKQDLEIPAGTQPGNVLILRGRGVPDPHGSRRVGDLHVQVMLEVPTTLTAKQKQALRELAELERANVTPERKSFLDRLKDFIMPAADEAPKAEKAAK